MLWRVIGTTIGMLPWGACRWAGALIGLITGHVLRVRRAHTLAAVSLAQLPNPRKLVGQIYRSLGTTVVETLWLSKKNGPIAGNILHVDSSGEARLRELLSAGRGLVVATAHTGNWDLLACALAARFRVLVVAKHPSMRGLDSFWRGIYTDFGVTLVDPEHAMSAAGEHLAAGGVVAFAIDQAPERRSGVLAGMFMGQPARLDMSFALVAGHFRAPVAVIFDERIDDGTHVMRLAGALQSPSRRSLAWANESCVTASALLERFVRRCPEQWLWLHRRWKNYDSAPISQLEADRR